MITTAIFPGRYVQGAGAIEHSLADELLRLGKKALVLQDPVVHQKAGRGHRQGATGKDRLPR
ncbi:Glycerol dehydrogenase [Leminorella grimontii]|nr:Glycerol dehydrogenase [Leminorella grimontii]